MTDEQFVEKYLTKDQIEETLKSGSRTKNQQGQSIFIFDDPDRLPPRRILTKDLLEEIYAKYQKEVD